MEPATGTTFVEKKLIESVYSAMRRLQDDLVVRICWSKSARAIILRDWSKYEYKSPILEASRFGLFKCVRFFYEYAGMDPSKLPLPADSPLHHAAKSGNLQVVKYLAEVAHCDPHRAISYTGATPLHSAAKRGHLDIVKYLVEKAKVDPAREDNYGHNAMHMAAQNGHQEILVYLHKTGKLDASKSDKLDICALEMAARAGYIDIAQYLVEQANVLEHLVYSLSTVVRVGKYSNILVKAIVLACEQGHNELLKYLIQAVIDIEHKRAQISNHTAGSLETFMRYSEKSEALFKSIVNGHTLILQTLLLHFKLDDRMGSSIFRLAANKGQIDIVRFLIRFASNVNLFLPDAQGVSALHVASGSLDIRTIKFLIEKAMLPPLARTNSGDSILHFAIRSRQAVAQRKYEVITHLLSVASELVEALNNSGETVYDLLNAPHMDKNLSVYLKALFDQVKMTLKIARQKSLALQQSKTQGNLKRKIESEEIIGDNANSSVALNQHSG